MRISEIRKHLPAGLALTLYLTVSLLYFGTTRNYSHRYLGIGNDPHIFIWCLNWWPWAITLGLKPFVSHYIWYPRGYNLTWATSVPAAALLIWPLTWLANPVVSFNVLSLLAPALSAWTAFLLARYLTRDTFASLIGGYLFGFSSYELGQLLGHLHMNLIVVVPLFLLFVVQRVRGDLSRPRFVAALATATLVQLGFSTEILATSCLFGAIAWLIFLTFSPREERQRLWVVAGDIILSGAITVVLAAPFLFFAFKGLTGLPDFLNDPESYSADLLNYLVPTRVTRIRGDFFVNVASRFPGNPSEQGAYLGVPLILILIFQFLEIRRRPYLKPVLVNLVVLLLFSLGPTLHVAGVRTGLSLPWRLAVGLPFIRHALPTRFSMFIALLAAMVAALWLSESRHGWDRTARFALAALACLFLMPNPAMAPPWTPLPQEPFFQPQNVACVLGRGANIIVLPFGNTGPSMIWQLQSGMRFTQSGGNIGYPPQAEWAWPILRNFYLGVGGPSFENDISSFCSSHRVSAILVGPGTPAPLAAAVEALHWQEEQNHGVRVVHAPDRRDMHF